MFKKIQFVILASAIILVSSCKKSDDPVPVDPNVTFKATLSGASESTPNTSTATGTATVTFNTTTKILTAAVTYSGLTSNSGHIHKGAVGVSGGVIFGFSPFASPISYTSVALDATQEADLNANLYYVNIHSVAFPAGEIRGQLIKQ